MMQDKLAVASQVRITLTRATGEQVAQEARPGAGPLLCAAVTAVERFKVRLQELRGGKGQ
jgi:hypothetical protein